MTHNQGCSTVKPVRRFRFIRHRSPLIESRDKDRIAGSSWAILCGLALLVCIGFDAQILCVVPPRSLEEMFPRDGVLLFHALEREDGILRAAFDEDLASFSVVRY